jgi:FkbM family methyltransferase
MALVRMGLLKKKYPELFFLKTLIKPGDICFDIGANVGYYSWFMLKHTGNNGKVYAVEPVHMFSTIWKNRIKKHPSKCYELFPFALGDENKTVQMGTPSINGVVHHGMTKIMDNNTANIVATHEVEMRIPDELFSTIEKIDFLKIDVEGYESLVFENMQTTIKRTYPIIQAELSGTENRKKVISLLESLAYKTCVLDDNKLIVANEEVKNTSATDFYFIPKGETI